MKPTLRRTATWVSMMLLSLPLAASEPVGADRTSAQLALGIRQVGDGDHETAVFTLDSVVRKLAAQPARRRELARAYLYLGVAYVGLDHEEVAKSKFREVLKLEPALRPRPEEFPSRVLQVFETQVLATTAAQKKRSARRFLILGGIGAVGAVGYAVANPGRPPNRDPTAEITVSPEGAALAGITTMTFEATGADRDGDPLTFTWDFGDGANASGETVTHVFAREGSFNVVLTAADGGGGSATAQLMVVSRTLNGTWHTRRREHVPFRCTQSGTALDCRIDRPNDPGYDPFANYPGIYINRWHGTISDPRGIDVALVLNMPETDFQGRCIGTLSPSLDCFRCVDDRAGPEVFFRQEAGSCR